MISMTAGSLVAELRARQWVVRDVDGVTVGWISPAAATWSVSLFEVSGGPVLGPFADPRAALEALAQRGATG